MLVILVNINKSMWARTFIMLQHIVRFDLNAIFFVIIHIATFDVSHEAHI